MTHGSDNDVPLSRGLYDHLVSAALRTRIDVGGGSELAELGEVDPEDAHAAVAQYLERLIASSLSTLRGKDTADRQRRLVDRVIAALVAELGDDWADRFNLADPLRRLLAVHAAPGPRPAPRPDTPLARSALLTGTRLDPSLALQLAKEFASAGHWDFNRRPDFREGVLHMPGPKVDAFFVTLHKTEEAYAGRRRLGLRRHGAQARWRHPGRSDAAPRPAEARDGGDPVGTPAERREVRVSCRVPGDAGQALRIDHRVARRVHSPIECPDLWHVRARPRGGAMAARDRSERAGVPGAPRLGDSGLALRSGACAVAGSEAPRESSNDFSTSRGGLARSVGLLGLEPRPAGRPEPPVCSPDFGVVMFAVRAPRQSRGGRLA